MTPQPADVPVDVIMTGLAFPEGPMFDDAGSLWWSEILGGRVSRRSRDGKVDRFETGGKPNGMAISDSVEVLYCDGQRDLVCVLDPVSGETRAITAPLNAPNDLAFDSAGNLIFSCPGNSRTEPTGYVCCLTPAGTLSTIADGLFFPNGVAFSADGQTLFIAETYRQRVWCGAWDSTRCTWIDSQPKFETTTGPNGPDGLAIGDDGTLYVAVYGSGCIDVFHPMGERIGAIATPGRNPTNCAFDPFGELGLLVTEAERGELLGFAALGRGAPVFRGSVPSAAILC